MRRCLQLPTHPQTTVDGETDIQLLVPGAPAMREKLSFHYLGDLLANVCPHRLAMRVGIMFALSFLHVGQTYITTMLQSKSR